MPGPGASSIRLMLHPYTGIKRGTLITYPTAKVGAPVIHKYQFEIGKRLRQDALHTRAESVFGIVDRYNDRNHSFAQLKLNIRSMGFTASAAIAGSISTVGQSYFRELYIFSREFFFIYSHSLQLQPSPPSLTSGGTG